MVATTWATASSVFDPKISPNAPLKLTVTTDPWVVADRISTLSGMAVVIPWATSPPVGPPSMAVMMEVKGAGTCTIRCTDTSCCADPRR